MCDGRYCNVVVIGNQVQQQTLHVLVVTMWTISQWSRCQQLCKGDRIVYRQRLLCVLHLSAVCYTQGLILQLEVIVTGVSVSTVCIVSMLWNRHGTCWIVVLSEVWVTGTSCKSGRYNAASIHSNSFIALLSHDVFQFACPLCSHAVASSQ